MLSYLHGVVLNCVFHVWLPVNHHVWGIDIFGIVSPCWLKINNTHPINIHQYKNIKFKYSKNGYSEHAYNKLTLTAEWFSFPETLIHVVNLTDITNWLGLYRRKIASPWQFVLSVFYYTYHVYIFTIWLTIKFDLHETNLIFLLYRLWCSVCI